MSTVDFRIDQFLNMIKAEERSSPAGMHWQEFYEFLQTKNLSNQRKPPVPLILAASAESDAAKHSRLSSQLQWALENGCLDEAIRRLLRIPADKWNSCPLDQWEQDSYPRC
jgi:hypothetical protein